jgi:hypothetical protein
MLIIDEGRAITGLAETRDDLVLMIVNPPKEIVRHANV